MRLIILTFLLLNSIISFAQPDLTDLELVDSIRTDYIRTVEFRSTANELSMPIINLKNGRLICEFDDSYGDFMDYYYTVKHCDKQWNFTEDIEVSDYLDGPDELQIEDFQSSVNTIMNYNHYRFTFPNDDISFNWSGNYMLIVYDDEGTVVITRRFYVVDEQLEIKAAKTRAMGEGVYDTHQAFDVSLELGKMVPLNPTEELYVTAFQNRLNEHTLPFINPLRMANNMAIFNKMDQLSFPGIKEYRFFDTRTILQAGENVQLIDISDKHALILLELTKKRDNKPYYFRSESNGAFVLRNADRDHGSKEVTSEYPHVLFTLQSYAPEYGEVYVVGEFNDFKATEAFRMEYLPDRQAYNLEVPLKQGFYNYLYALKRPDQELDYLELEGSSFETENEYHFFSYYRPLSGEYDQLIGYYKYHENASSRKSYLRIDQLNRN